ncbi:MAG TPA: S46 family peptidase [Thermoanaerobaculia bacterium]|nr:S46 family peptidase [Thermoanaerobaculia bacterium]
MNNLCRCRLVAFVLGLLAVSGTAVAIEGKWTPEQILELGPKWLREQGLQVAPETLWSREGGGLLDAAVRIGGCSAGFISERGLLVTNHHCAFGILQQHSTPQRDLITDGFLAQTPADELPGSGVRATVPHRITDVTAEVEAAVPAKADDLVRFKAIERKKKDLVAACEQQANRRCEVATFDGGVLYQLNESLEYPDVRLVYAPPRAVGEYGGEVDNWSWPRHTGDFALLRVYSAPDGQPAAHATANVPYHPQHFFPVAAEGLENNSFIMLVGYPVRTYRSYTEAEMAERATLFYPGMSALYRGWLDVMEAASAQNETARIALADRIKVLANNEKNARGQVAGLRRGHILENKTESEKAIVAWAASHPEQRDALAARETLARLVAERRHTWDRDFLLDQMRRGPKPLDLALSLVRWAGEKAKPDLEREPDYQERNRDILREKLERDQKRMHLATEAALLTDVLARLANLPADSRVPAVEAFAGGARERASLRPRVDGLLAHSKVTDLAARKKMFDESADQLRARHDPLLDLAFSLDAELRALKERNDRFDGAISRLRPRWQRAVIAHAGKPVAPDANGTLRVTLGHVQGYVPRDGMWMRPQTTLAGVVEKNTGEEPFAAPKELLTAAAKAPMSRWAASKLKDVPVNFLADADTTGGNSGSPVLNHKGELVGVNFDRVWENVANDFGYDPNVARNVSVDIRYLLWMLEALNGEAAKPLLKEMGVPEKAR